MFQTVSSCPSTTARGGKIRLLPAVDTPAKRYRGVGGFKRDQTAQDSSREKHAGWTLLWHQAICGVEGPMQKMCSIHFTSDLPLTKVLVLEWLKMLTDRAFVKSTIAPSASKSDMYSLSHCEIAPAAVVVGVLLSSATHHARPLHVQPTAHGAFRR
ncbi:hypothetical protein CC78DRAFT_576525 [Lojkania enalia]|uniref:Uncharacterized protein n=1 Tax=Lojkania enalia TaxID=147567 RepID=A0A9P4KFW6_9PLEO|nr:hypothetical protein CC78DRAFT_576525 [Didymosphaeria enalia]